MPNLDAIRAEMAALRAMIPPPEMSDEAARMWPAEQGPAVRRMARLLELIVAHMEARDAD